MDEWKRQQRGSPARDAFKCAHKRLASCLYGCDVDFVLVEKHPPGIVAAIDYKKTGDEITFSEVIAYNNFVNVGIAVYIVSGEDPECGPFVIHKYCGGDYKQPTYKLELCRNVLNMHEFQDWEFAVRREYRERKRLALSQV